MQRACILQIEVAGSFAGHDIGSKTVSFYFLVFALEFKFDFFFLSAQILIFIHLPLRKRAKFMISRML